MEHVENGGAGDADQAACSVMAWGEVDAAGCAIRQGESSFLMEAVESVERGAQVRGEFPDSTDVTPSNIVVTFDAAAFTRARFREMDTPDAYGLLRWFEEDRFSRQGGHPTECIAYVNLMGGDPGANDPSKQREDKLMAKVLGYIERLDRKD